MHDLTSSVRCWWIVSTNFGCIQNQKRFSNLKIIGKSSQKVFLTIRVDRHGPTIIVSPTIRKILTTSNTDIHYTRYWSTLFEPHLYWMVFPTVLKNLISISCFQEFSQQTIKTIVFLFLRLAFTSPRIQRLDFGKHKMWPKVFINCQRIKTDTDSLQSSKKFDIFVWRDNDWIMCVKARH